MLCSAWVHVIILDVEQVVVGSWVHRLVSVVATHGARVLIERCCVWGSLGTCLYSTALDLLGRSFRVVDRALAVILQKVDVSMLATVIADGHTAGLRIHDRVWIPIFDYKPSKANLLWLNAYDTWIRTNHRCHRPLDKSSVWVLQSLNPWLHVLHFLPLQRILISDHFLFFLTSNPEYLGPFPLFRHFLYMLKGSSCLWWVDLVCNEPLPFRSRTWQAIPQMMAMESLCTVFTGMTSIQIRNVSMSCEMQGVDIVLMSGYHRFVMSVSMCTPTTVFVAFWSSCCHLSVTSLNFTQLRAAAFITTDWHGVCLRVAWHRCWISSEVHAVFKDLGS